MSSEKQIRIKELTETVFSGLIKVLAGAAILGISTLGLGGKLGDAPSTISRNPIPLIFHNNTKPAGKVIGQTNGVYTIDSGNEYIYFNTNSNTYTVAPKPQEEETEIKYGVISNKLETPTIPLTNSSNNTETLKIKLEELAPTNTYSTNQPSQTNQ